MVYHDRMSGNLYVSLDEGKTFDRAEHIPEGTVVMVFEHPADNRYVCRALHFQPDLIFVRRDSRSQTELHTTEQRTEEKLGGRSTSHFLQPRSRDLFLFIQNPANTATYCIRGHLANA